MKDTDISIKWKLQILIFGNLLVIQLTVEYWKDTEGYLLRFLLNDQNYVFTNIINKQKYHLAQY